MWKRDSAMFRDQISSVQRFRNQGSKPNGGFGLIGISRQTHKNAEADRPEIDA
jgi:hypothetical protein